MTSHRVARLNEQVKRELTDILRNVLRDPRVSDVTVTRVQTTSDLQQSRIFITTLATDEERQTIMEGLLAARAFLRTGLAQRIQLRRVPELLFEWDTGLDHARRIEELLAQVMPADPDPADRAEVDDASAVDDDDADVDA
jgi:ribosome-binding factor A